MLPHIRIPSHITALYIFTVVNLVALLNITLVDANILVLNRQNETLEELPDLPARFGPSIPEHGLWGHIAYAKPHNACVPIEPAPTINGSAHRWIALIRRHDCDFDKKVRHAQEAGFIGALVHNVNSDELVPMGGGQEEGVKIPSAFIGETDATYLWENFNKKLNYWVVLDNNIPFNPNMYLLPFAIVVGICFVLMLVFMVAKWVRDVRRRQRSRLSKTNLKKIPIKKYKKGDQYDCCAICLDDYEEGEKLRVLPCGHAYHMKCVDPWLTNNKKVCPVCKRKVMPGKDDSDSDSDSDGESNATSESAPLLSSSNNTPSRPRSNTFENSGLPTGNNPESGDDTASASVSVGTSVADVHDFGSPRSNQGYGSLATAHVATEIPTPEEEAIATKMPKSNRKKADKEASKKARKTKKSAEGKKEKKQKKEEADAQDDDGAIDSEPGPFGSPGADDKEAEDDDLLGAVGGATLVEDHFTPESRDPTLDLGSEQELRSIGGDSAKDDSDVNYLIPKKTKKKKVPTATLR